ncbi:MAG: YabP/YqfC family sporulation protein [Clostridia bacterium]|nr:YabP/YqfC family sporulation protein [Clostridia bacterium]
MEEGHNLSVEQCKRVTATAVTEVDAFSDKQIVLSYSGGRIVVTGSGMKIINFSKTSGSFCATGEINGVRYLAKGGSLKQKLFK